MLDNRMGLAEGEFMANLKGLASIVSELRVERTNLVNQLKRALMQLSRFLASLFLCVIAVQ
jgi:hypothetical protein